MTVKVSPKGKIFTQLDVELIVSKQHENGYTYFKGLREGKEVYGFINKGLISLYTTEDDIKKNSTDDEGLPLITEYLNGNIVINLIEKEDNENE